MEITAESVAAMTGDEPRAAGTMEITAESVAAMTADELRAALTEYKNADTIGPITQMTRKVYEKLLLQFAGVFKDDLDGAISGSDEFEEAEDAGGEDFVLSSDNSDHSDVENIQPEKIHPVEKDGIKRRHRPSGDAFRSGGVAEPMRRAPSTQNLVPPEENNLSPIQAVLFTIVVIAVAYILIVGF